MRTRGSERTRNAETSTAIVLVLPAGKPITGRATFQPPRPSGTSRTGDAGRTAFGPEPCCDSETWMDVSLLKIQPVR